MPTEISTRRLLLVALSATQLKRCLDDLTGLGNELGLSMAEGIVDPNVVRAINMKSAKMASTDPALHDWFTYWLIVVKDVPAGVGLIGFKGNPDANGKAEIGYGIDAGYRNQGYTTEAVKALCGWALAHDECRALTASTVLNPASEAVLQKAGWKKVRQGDGASDWEILR